MRTRSVGLRLAILTVVREFTPSKPYTMVGSLYSSLDTMNRTSKLINLAGRCLDNEEEQNRCAQLLSGIEDELGWASKYRVRDLYRAWDRKPKTVTNDGL